MKENKRELVISAAITLFSHTHDFQRVSLEAIAKEARVSPTTIYNNFVTRKNLVNEVIKNLIRTNLERNRATNILKPAFSTKAYWHNQRQARHGWRGE